MSHPLLAELACASAERRRRACEAAPEDPSAVLLVGALAECLGDREPEVCRAAGAALQRIGRGPGQASGPVLAALRPALRGESARERLEAAWTWARLEPPPLALLPAVVSCLEEADGDGRWRAARLLVELARLHAEAAPVVSGLAAAEQPARVRRIALAALRELSPGEPTTLDAHLEACRDPDPGLRRLALTGLAGLGARSEEVWSALTDALAPETDATTRRAAALAVVRLEQAPGALQARAEQALAGSPVSAAGVPDSHR